MLKTKLYNLKIENSIIKSDMKCLNSKIWPSYIWNVKKKKKDVNAYRVDVFDTDILVSVTGVQFIPCSFCDITLLNLKLAAFHLWLCVILRSVCLSLKPQWTLQLEFSSSFQYICKSSRVVWFCFSVCYRLYNNK